MKKNQNGVSHDTTGCGKVADPLAFEISNRDNFCNDTENRCSLVADDFINEIVHSRPKDNQNETLKGHGGDTALLSSESNEADQVEGSVSNFISSNEDENKDSAVKENENVFLSYSNCTGSDPDSFLSEATNRNEISNASEYRHSVVVDELTSTYENKSRDFSEPCSISLELLKKDMDLYTDKNVMECELPELEVFYKDSTANIVKDICVDEGLPSKDKMFFDCSEEDLKSHCPSLMACDESEKSNIMKENIDTTLFVQDGLRPTSEKGCDMDTTKECISEAVDTESLVQNNLQLPASIVKDASKECLADDPIQIGEANYRATNKIVTDFSSDDYASNITLSALDCDTQKPLALLFLDEDFKYDSNTVEEQSGQISSVKPNSEVGNLVVATGESNKDRPNDNLFYDNKVENGNSNSDLDSSKSAAHSRDEEQGVVHLRPIEVKNVTRHGGSLFDNHAVPNQVLCGEGESSFSAGGPISGLISSSEPIAYSGSLSRRSDSSTTSTRSFAFPVLQSELKGSPVRMAKADRRQYQRHRGWKLGLLCCRF